ncbi:hypothetical protein FNYG_07374 [Fusarium nygamai]|uniref:Uncharacterized protein n=1 Tax=Gibberella nygamai TaxID=42673 RepID=A0A2K0WAI5_GIBNY|nr:hypothetical protein FNYG_07374 [Fusarium nygamai]
MHCNYFLLGLAVFAATALGLPTGKPADTGKQVPALYEAKGDNFDDGQLVHEELEKRMDDGSWHSGKYEGKDTGHDDGSWRPGKYEGDCTGFDDGNWITEENH